MTTGEFPRCATKFDFFARADSGENDVPDAQVSIDPLRMAGEKMLGSFHSRNWPKASLLGHHALDQQVSK
jgi:hypothetical protein